MAEQTFEQAMKQLSDIVQQLEQGEIELEEAIVQFQQGMALSKVCHTKLQQVEQQLDLILQENGEVAPFDVQGE